MNWAAAPAHELAQLYHARWQVEAVFDELKTHLRQSRRVLRSKTPDLVRQEFYGWVLAHYAVRWLLHQGVSRHKLKHAEHSLIAHVNILRSALPQSGAFSPLHPRKRRRWFEQLLAQCTRLKAVRTTNKRSPRMVKRRNSPYASFSRQLPRKQPFDPNPMIAPPKRQRYKLHHLYKDKF